MVVLDGVYTIAKSGKAKFHRVPAPNQTELQSLLNRLIHTSPSAPIPAAPRLRYMTHHLPERTDLRGP